ncbi:MAG: anhydro-N-acetylmuramic acid kinase [Actinobacteria bacterium]|nr:anhydro-N-acetylmuramic acid kinase [Actinomycetota bacterium]
MRVLGMISGTSHDGIDAAVVDFTLDGGTLHGRVLHHASTPYDPQLRAALVAALPPARTTLAEVCRLDTLIGQAFAQVAAEAAELVGGVDLITSHGQTVYHWVHDDHALGTLQLGQPAWIAERTGAPVVSDVRARDVAAGGHGAPLVAFLDRLLLAGRSGTAASLNLGGISNVTVVPATGELSAFDIGPANALIDAVVTDRGLHPAGYDEEGRIAASGRVDPRLLEVLLDDPYYRLPTPRSTGKEHFHLEYVRDAIRRAGTDPSSADLVATLTELTVRTVVDAIAATGATFLAAAGGGCRNPMMLGGIRAGLPHTQVVLTDELGAPADEKEAIAFALIGWCTVHGVPATVASGTGARGARVLGSITPGARPLTLPAAVPGPLEALRLSSGSADPVRPPVELRPAVADDLDAITAVFLACWQESYADVLPPAALTGMTPASARALWARALAEPSGPVLVACDPQDGRLLGLTRYAVEGDLGWVHSLYVAPGTQGRGIGGTLLDGAMAALRALGVPSAALWVFEANLPSLQFYRRRGWAADGTRRTQPELADAPQIRLVHGLDGTAGR